MYEASLLATVSPLAPLTSQRHGIPNSFVLGALCFAVTVPCVPQSALMTADGRLCHLCLLVPVLSDSIRRLLSLVLTMGF